MKITPVPALLSLVLIVSGCTRMKVTSERDKAYDFSRIITYCWIEGPETILDEADTYINENIRMALDRELIRRGWRSAEDADIQVAYYVKLREEQEYTDPAARNERDFSGGFVYSRKSKGWSYEEREPDLNVYTVEIGTLTVLMYDTGTGERIWRGNLQTKIDRSQPKEKKEEHIRTAAEKLIDRLP